MNNNPFAKINDSNIKVFLESEYYSSEIKINVFEYWITVEPLISYQLKIVKEVLKHIQAERSIDSLLIQNTSTPEEIQQVQNDYYGIKSDLNLELSYQKRVHLSKDKLITYLNQFVKDSEVSEIESRKIPSSLHLAEFAYFFNKLHKNGWFGNPTSGESINQNEYATLLLRAFNVKNQNGEFATVGNLCSMFSKHDRVNTKFRAKVDEAIVKISEVEEMRNDKKRNVLKK
jgi:hypothetical protein